MNDVIIEIRNPARERDNDRPREVSVKVKSSTRRSSGPLELKTENLSKVSRMSQNHAYVNPAFVGSHSENRGQARIQMEPPIDTVYREQYCVCSRWTRAKKISAIAVGILFGAVLGLTLSMTLRDPHTGLIDFPLLRSNAVPD